MNLLEIVRDARRHLEESSRLSLRMCANSISMTKRSKR
jgi:hypothetical protein